MPSNPLIAQGTLNRLIGSVVIPSFQALNVSASYLGKRGISFELGDMATQVIDTMVGIVTSPEPYMPATLTIPLLKTQPLASNWINQVALNSVLGTVTVYPDTRAYPAFDCLNCSVTRIGSMSFAGEDPTVVFTLQGYYPINGALWNLT